MRIIALNDLRSNQGKYESLTIAGCINLNGQELPHLFYKLEL